ncbi:MAG: tetratricopeptide repeat protein, partial [Terriglobales bacterium]
LDKLKSQYKSDPDVDLAAGRLYREMGLYDRAEAEYREALRLKYFSIEANVAMCELSLQKLDNPTALTYARRACNLDPHSSKAGIALASALIASGRLREAEQQVNKLLATDPHSAQVQYVGYKLAIERGEITTAQKRLEAAVRLGGDPAEWLVDLSEVYKTLGDYAAAKRCLVRALSKEPYSLDALSKLATLEEFYLRDYNKAIEQYRNILAIDGDSVTALAGLDRCKVKKNDIAGMLKFELQNFVDSTVSYWSKPHDQ